MGDSKLENLSIDTIRFLAVDTVQKANSGHPGTPMGAAPMAYVLWEGQDRPGVVLVGTGSEVHIALEAGKPLQDKDIKADVVSLPSWELFDAQPPEYRDSVLPAGELYGQFGFTAQRMAEEAENLVKGSKA